MDSLRVLNNKRVIWLNVTGSGNETSAYVQENTKMTLMFAAIEGKPMILRPYGKASVIHPGEAGWHEWLPLFDARQRFDLSIDLVQTSCGMAVPLFDYVADRNHLKDWAQKRVMPVSRIIGKQKINSLLTASQRIFLKKYHWKGR